MDVELFDYSSIVDREPIEWPDGARVAFYVGLNAESADSGRVMALALHPFVIGQAFRLKYLDQALKYIAGHEGVWLTTSDKIAAHYARGGPGIRGGCQRRQPRRRGHDGRVLAAPMRKCTMSGNTRRIGTTRRHPPCAP